MSDKYAVVGNPVKHSLSPKIHHMFAEQTGEDIEYGRILAHNSLAAEGSCSTPAEGSCSSSAEGSSFTDSVQQFFDEGGLGVNVTLPFKEQAAEWVNELSAEARIAGAVNTITRLVSSEDRDKEIASQMRRYKGHNTDGLGLLHDLKQNIGLELDGLKTLILGAGGACRGIVAPLLQAGAKLHVANRTFSRAHSLVQNVEHFLPQEKGNIGVQSLDACAASYDLVINASSAAARGEPVQIPSVCSGAFCYDLFYQLGGQTEFCTLARAQGADRTSDGLGMLVEQAAEAFLIWRGIRPDSTAVISVLRAVSHLGEIT